LDKQIAGSIALLLWKLVEFYGHDAGKNFGTLGIDWELLAREDGRISYELYDDMLAITEALITEPGAGLTVTNFWHPSTLGALGYAMLSSSNLRVAIDRLIRFQAVEATESAIIKEETNTGLVLYNEGFRHQNNQHPLLVDIAISIWLHICRFNIGEVFDPVEVNLMRAKPENPGKYYAFYRCPINFGAARNSLVLPQELLDKPLAVGNKQLAQMHDQVLQRYLDEHARGVVTSKVRASIISHLPCGDFNKELVASELCMSSRTLQRKLEDEDTTYNDVLNDTRRELALRYIKEDSLPLTEISFLLGFSDSAAFSRAFKRWTGQAPSQAQV